MLHNMNTKGYSYKVHIKDSQYDIVHKLNIKDIIINNHSIIIKTKGGSYEFEEQEYGWITFLKITESRDVTETLI